MRVVILCLMVFSLAALEDVPREEFTLTDGRVLVGTYHQEFNALLLDDGKTMIRITPEQIQDRKAAAGEAKAIDAQPLTKKEAMTSEEKAVTEERFKQGKKKSAAQALLGEANKADRDATALLAKSQACREKARTVAKSFQARAAKEGEHYSIESILKEPIITRKTHENNNGVLSLDKDAERYALEAADKKETARSKRAEADAMLDSGEAERPQAAPGPQRAPAGEPKSHPGDYVPPSTTSGPPPGFGSNFRPPKQDGQ